MVERFSGSGNRRGELKPPKKNHFPAHNSIDEPIIQTRTVGRFKKFVPSPLPIDQNGLQEVKPYINNVGCPPTPGHIVIPVVKERDKKVQKAKKNGRK